MLKPPLFPKPRFLLPPLPLLEAGRVGPRRPGSRFLPELYFSQLKAHPRPSPPVPQPPKPTSGSERDGSRISVHRSERSWLLGHSRSLRRSRDSQGDTWDALEGTGQVPRRPAGIGKAGLEQSQIDKFGLRRGCPTRLAFNLLTLPAAPSSSRASQPQAGAAARDRNSTA